MGIQSHMASMGTRPFGLFRGSGPPQELVGAHANVHLGEKRIQLHPSRIGEEGAESLSRIGLTGNEP